jgi:sensor histidine kinase YesM
MLLQPLVENAIRHGVSPRAAGGTVTVSARRDANQLLISIEDDGVGMPENRAAAGVGLANTRTRLAHLYGRAHSMQIRPAPGGGSGTIVDIRLPFRRLASDT